MSQSATSFLLIRPEHFLSDPQTARDNIFQCEQLTESVSHSTQEAQREFDTFVKVLRGAGLELQVFKDLEQKIIPNAVFPNNWLSTDVEGTVCLYPLKTESRRSERREEIIADLKAQYPKLIDLREEEGKELFLEGSGSLVLDRSKKIAYASISERTHKQLVERWCALFGYEPVCFQSYSREGVRIYHTNIVLSVCSRVAIFCREAVKPKKDGKRILQMLRDSGKHVIEISLDQLYSFCGNVLEARSQDGRTYFVMSDCARNGFEKEQLGLLQQHGEILSSDLTTIEKYGGGSARCMLAELF